MGGKQPIQSSLIQFYAVGQTGNGSARPFLPFFLSFPLGIASCSNHQTRIIQNLVKPLVRPKTAKTLINTGD
jgi:hypothetical protein